MPALTKSYSTFDCDAHVTDLPQIWDHVAAKDRELVKNWYWADGDNHVVNGQDIKRGAWAHPKFVAASSFEATGPGVTKPILKKIYDMQVNGELTPEQILYTNHAGSRDPRVRVADMDIMGIDQVVVIPISMFIAHPMVENIYAADIMARAYNDWAHDWCSVAPDRLFAAATLALQSPELSAAELHRAAKRDFPLGVVRAADLQSNYPNQAKFAPVWRAFEETGLACAMHTLPFGRQSRHAPHLQASPGEFGTQVLDPSRSHIPGRGIGFAYEATLWVTNALLSGFLEQYPKLTMAMMECNSSWLPFILEECDRALHLYKNLRQSKVSRLPSEIFMERCFCAFEGDETPVFRQYKYFEDIAIWSSDVYHYDGADAWAAIREMEELDVPVEVQAKLMGGNARRMYKIEPKMVVTKQSALPPRPAWFPTEEQAKREYAAVMRVP